MRLLFSKIRCPSFMCFCKPSASLYTPGPLKLESSPHHHVPSIAVVSVADDADHSNEGSKADAVAAGVVGTQNCLKSSLRKAALGSKAVAEEDKKRVQWVDFLGKQLVEIREYRPSETEDIDSEDRRNTGCACIVL